MDNKNLGEESLNSQLLRDLGASAGNAAKQEGMLSAAEKALAQRVAEQTAAQQQLADSIHLASIKMVSFGSGLANNAGNDFGSINKVIDATTKVMGGLMSMIPYVGGALDGIAKGAGEVAKFMVTTFARAYGNFEKLSDTGVIATFQDLKTNSDASGLTFADTAKVMGQYSKELALFGGNALTGAKRFQAIANDTKELSMQFQKIGISAGDFADFQLNYINQQNLARRGQTMTDKQIEDGSKAYIEQLDSLAKLTGQTRKEIQGDINERMKNTRYVAAIAALPEKIKATIDGVITNTKQLGPEVSESLIELVSNSGVANSDDAKALQYALGRGGIDPKFYTDLKAGRYSADEANKIIMTALGRYSKSEGDAAIQLSNTSVQTKFYVAGVKANILAQKQNAGQLDEIAKNRQDVIDSTDDANSDLAKARREMYGTTRNLDLLATSSNVMTTVMKGMADGIDKVTEELYNLLGDDLPEYIKLRREEFKKQTELNNMRRDLNKQLELETKLKTLNPDSKEYREADDQLKTLKFNNYNWGKLLTDQIKTTEHELRDIQTRRRVADEKEMAGSTGSASSGAASSGTPSTPSGTPSSPSGTPGGTPNSPSGTPSGTPNETSNGTPGSSDTSQSSSAANASAAGAASDRIVKVLSSGAGEIKVELADGSVVTRGGSVAWRGNNPGNLRWADWEKAYNAVGVQNAGNNGQFAVFATRQDGVNAQMSLIFNNYANLTLAQLMEKYDKGNATRYTKTVSDAAGVPSSTVVKNLTADQKTKLIDAIHKAEGSIPGPVKVISGPTQRPTAAATSPTPAAASSSPVAAPVGANLGTTGAVRVSGASTGFPAVLSGNTAVIPANSGSEAAATQQASAPTNQTRMAQMMASKVDKMIDITQEHVRDTRRAVTA